MLTLPRVIMSAYYSVSGESRTSDVPEIER